MTQTVKLRLPAMYPKQAEAIMAPERYAVIEASPKAGKTLGCILWIMNEAGQLGGPNRHFWWVAPVYDQTDIAFRRMKGILRQADPDGRFWSANESRKTIRIPNGSTFWFKSADKPDTLYGEDVYGAVLDEAVRMKADSWIAVRSTLTATQGRIRMISNVRGRKNWLWPLARKAEAGEANWHYARLTAYDAAEAGVIASEEIADAKAVLPPAVFRELYEAVAADDEGNPFGIKAIHACIGGNDDWRGGEPVVCWGVDLAAYTDWTVAIGLNEHGEVAQFHRWQGPWDITESRLVPTIGQLPAFVDMTGVGQPIVERLQLKCGGVEGERFSAPRKQELIMGLASAIHQRRVHYPAGTIVHELESFEYVVKTTAEGRVTGVSYQAAGGMHDDCVDALALAVRAHAAGAYAPAFAVEIDSGADDDDDEDEDQWVQVTLG